jgi:hypothetical protein
MALADRIVHQDPVTSAPVGDIPVHEFTAAFNLYVLGEATRAQVIAVFSLTAADETGLDTLKTTYDALATLSDKLEFKMKLESAGIFYQNGKIDKTKYMSIMGL